MVFEPVDFVRAFPQELQVTSVVAWEYTTCSASHSLQDIFWNLLEGLGMGI